MQIRRIAIQDFRRIKAQTIADLVDGLNVLVGDNEAGKSTTLAALRAAFFERHRVGGAVAEAMLPYGSAVRPTVAIDFELDGKPWSLVKSFVQRPEASLEGPGERHAGDAVEERLAELFGFTPPGRGGSDPKQHHGTHGLLWVEQGPRDRLGVGAGRDTLAGALEREVGQVTGGERGRALLAAAEARRERFWDKRDRPRGPLGEARRRVEELEGEQAALQVRQREMDERLARLEAVNARLERHRRDDHLGRAATAAAAAERLVQEAARRGMAHEAAMAGLRDAERALAEAQERQERRHVLVSKREASRRDAERAETVAAEARLLARQRMASVGETELRLTSAREAQDAADLHLRRGEAAARRQEAEAALADQRGKLAVAEDQAKRRREAAACAAAIRLDAESLAGLTTAERNTDRARAELDAASLQITFVTNGARSIAIDGATHDGTIPLSLSRDATLELEGFGRLHVQPGGGAAALRQRYDVAEQALRDALRRAGVASLSEARQQVQRRGEAQAEVAALDKTLTILAPKGIDALRQGIEDAAVRLSQTADPGEVLDAGDLAKARQAVDAARSAFQEAQRDGKAALLAHQAAATEAATLIERQANAQRQAAISADELAAARQAVDDDLLASRCVAAEVQRGQARLGADVATEALAAADAEAAHLALERAQTAEREIRRDLADAERQQRDLRVELRALGQDGLQERLTAIEGELDLARARLGAVEREAAASRLLYETLLAAQCEAKERWLGPVRARVAPYLRLIHPNSDIRMDDRTLEIEGLVRDGLAEDFNALSMGAREQVAVVTRLALADILRAAGHPAAVILDDALVNTDEARLERMRNVLTRAARGLQILIFTCRERDFLGLGATHRI